MLQSFTVIKSFSKIPSEFKLIIALFLIIFGLTYLIGGAGAERRKIYYLSSLEKGMYGTSEFHKLATKIGVDIERHSMSFSNGIPENTGMIIVLSPEIRFKDDEIDNITRWVEEGGILIYSDDMIDFLDLTRRFEFRFFTDLPVRGVYLPDVETDPLLTDDEYIRYEPEEMETDIFMTSLKMGRGYELFRDVNNLLCPMIYSRREMHRLYFEFPKKKDTDEGSNNDSDETNIDSLYSWLDTPNGWRVMASDKELPSVIMTNVSLGTVIALANPLIISNGFIRAGDNIIFARNLLNLPADDSKILIDEYRHGFDTEEMPSVTQTGWGRMLYFLLFVGMLAIYSKSLRFIPPKAVPPPQRRSQIEYLRSMAQILRRANALRLLATIILRDTRNLPQNNSEVIKLKSDLHHMIESDKITIYNLMDAYNELRKLEKRHQIRSK